MKTDVEKTNERWKKGCLLAFVAAIWACHFGSAAWFAVYSVPAEAEVLKREGRLFPFEHKAWTTLEVEYVRADGKRDTAKVEWRVTPAPPGNKIVVWRAETGLIKVGPASWAETFFVETLLGYLALFIGAVIGAVIICSKLKDRLKKRLARKP